MKGTMKTFNLMRILAIALLMAMIFTGCGKKTTVPKESKEDNPAPKGTSGAKADNAGMRSKI